MLGKRFVYMKLFKYAFNYHANSWTLQIIISPGWPKDLPKCLDKRFLLDIVVKPA